MKYDEFDAIQFVPSFLEINGSNTVQSTGYINKFFLDAFNTFCKQIDHICISQAAPYSLESCLLCSSAVVKDLFEQWDIPLYLDNSLTTNQKYIHRVSTTPFGTPSMVDNIIKYVCDRDTVTGTSTVTSTPHQYNVHVSGDSVGLDINNVITRILDQTNILMPVTETFVGFVIEDAFEDTSTYISDPHIYVGNVYEAQPSYIVYYNRKWSLHFDGDIAPQRTKHMQNYRTLTGDGLMAAKAAFEATTAAGDNLLRKSVQPYDIKPFSLSEISSSINTMMTGITSGQWERGTTVAHTFDPDLIITAERPSIEALHASGATLYAVTLISSSPLIYQASAEEPGISNWYWIDASQQWVGTLP